MTTQQVGPEPRGVTISDLLVVTLALAAAWAVALQRDASILARMSLIGLWVGSLPIAAAAVVLHRQFRYRRVADPAEFFLFVLAASSLVMFMPNVDSVLDGCHRTLYDTSLQTWSKWRWTLATVLTLFIMFVLAIASRLHERISPGISTTIDLLCTVLLIWGPLSVFARHLQLPWLMTALTSSDFAELIVEIRKAVREMPQVLLYAVTIYWAVVAIWNRRRELRWMSFLSGAFAIVTVTIVVFAIGVEAYRAGDDERIAMLIVRPAAFSLAFGLAVYVSRVFRPSQPLVIDLGE